MSNKEALATELFESLPEGLKSLSGVEFGEFKNFSDPSDVDGATITATKVLVDIHNNLIVPLSKLPLVDLALYIGSLNPVITAGMFAGLEYLGSSGPFDIIAPVDGGVYPGFFDAWTVRAEDADSIDVTVGEGEEAESFDLSQNDEVWTAKWPMPVGDHTATFTDGTQSMTVSFSVVSWDFYPPEGAEIAAGETEVSVDFGDIEPESVNIVLTNKDTGETLQTAETITSMLLEAGTWVFNLTVTLPAAIGASVHNLTNIHEFIVRGDTQA